MGKKISEESGPLKQIKAMISPSVFNALEMIGDTIGRSHSDVIKTALSEYIFKNYPNFIKKTDKEIRMQAEEEILLRNYARLFSDKGHADESIPVYEKSIKNRKNEIIDLQKKINTKNRKLKGASIPAKQKKEVEEELEELELDLSKYKHDQESNELRLQQYKNAQKF